MALLGLSTLILARRHHRTPSSVPFVISSKRDKFSSTVASRRLDAMPWPRSSRICNFVSPQTPSRDLTGTHLCLFGVIGICHSRLDHLDCQFVDLVEVIRCMGDFIPLDVQEMKILENRLLKLSLAAEKLSRSRQLRRTISHTFSFDGFVSSNRTISLPLYILAKYLLRMAAFAWPMWR